ncbi:hypothetical protein Bhyg_12547 [Pseudolycoriella hygida]|uniref:Uncharacterized protein n=1 Tax=Pseudolycoriella hygida TaxID=35572 RepID=A0A9Q0MZ31_9DIPT|nr:hypothetical protein Bhyg_12547 [Pseudolycoriella hygida]
MISSFLLAVGVEKKNVFLIVSWLVVQALTIVPRIPIVAIVLLCFAAVSFPVYVWWAVFSVVEIMRAAKAENRDRLPSSIIVPTAPLTTFAPTQFDYPPAYNEVVPDGGPKSDF